MLNCMLINLVNKCIGGGFKVIKAVISKTVLVKLYFPSKPGMPDGFLFLKNLTIKKDFDVYR